MACGNGRGRTARAGVLGAATILLWSACAFADPVGVAKLNFDVPVQPVDTALLVFAKQAHIQLLVAPDVLVGLPEAGISGQYDTSTALRILLRGTGLEFQFTSPDTVTVRPKSTRSNKD